MPQTCAIHLGSKNTLKTFKSKTSPYFKSTFHCCTCCYKQVQPRG